MPAVSRLQKGSLYGELPGLPIHDEGRGFVWDGAPVWFHHASPTGSNRIISNFRSGDILRGTLPEGCVRGEQERPQVFKGVCVYPREKEAHGKVGPLKSPFF